MPGVLGSQPTLVQHLLPTPGQGAEEEVLGKMLGKASIVRPISLGSIGASFSSTPLVSDLYEDVMLERLHGPHERCC